MRDTVGSLPAEGDIGSSMWCVQWRTEWPVCLYVKRQGRDTRSALGAAVTAQLLPDWGRWMLGAPTLRLLSLRRPHFPGAVDRRTIDSRRGFPLTARTASTSRKTSFSHDWEKDKWQVSFLGVECERGKNTSLIICQHIWVIYIALVNVFTELRCCGRLEKTVLKFLFLFLIG